MARTQEQIEADDALTAAVEWVARAYGILEDGDVLGDYVVVGGTQTLVGDELSHAHITMLRNNSVAGYTAVGLLESASFHIKASGVDA